MLVLARRNVRGYRQNGQLVSRRRNLRSRLVKPQDEGFSLFDAPHSPTHTTAADVGVNKEFIRSPSIEVVNEPSVQAEDTGKNTAA
ncbi:hypothetical protein Hanom_Chr05g00454171 [Helianthus anomalus]